MNKRLADLTSAGVSVWLDDLSRSRLESGNLRELVADYSVRGVTTNPTIFAAALKTDAYLPLLRREKLAGSDSEKAIFNITTEDVAEACDVFSDLYKESGGVDGRVSIEVSPDLAFDADRTIEEALALHAKVARENVMIKIPATLEGLTAITEVISRGISVNVTLIFSIERYAAVIDAYMSGLEKALANGISITGIHSVASFFVSRVDTEIDKRLSALGREELKSKAAVANARLAYGLFLEQFSAGRWKALESKGAQLQRPLMASTGVKDPALPDTLYVSELVAPNLVNTMPEKTLLAFADHGEQVENSIEPHLVSAKQLIKQLSDAGIDLTEVTDLLEKEGVEKFIASWHELKDSVGEALRNV
ncbi:MAG: transaldolase [Aquiluna sp.]